MAFSQLDYDRMIYEKQKEYIAACNGQINSLVNEIPYAYLAPYAESKNNQQEKPNDKSPAYMNPDLLLLDD